MSITLVSPNPNPNLNHTVVNNNNNGRLSTKEKVYGKLTIIRRKFAALGNE